MVSPLCEPSPLVHINHFKLFQRWSVAILMMVHHMIVAFDDVPTKAHVGTLKLTIVRNLMALHVHLHLTFLEDA
jgi:hypothetical protein